MKRAYKTTYRTTYKSAHLGSKLNVFEPELTTYMDGLTTPLSSTEKNLVNTLIKNLKTGLGVATLSEFFDYLNIRAGETAEQSLRNLAKNAHHSTAVNSPTFTAGEGFTGNGTSSYIEVDFTPSIDGINFTLNDASFGLYFRNFDRATVTVNGVYSTNAHGGLNNRLGIGSSSSSQVFLAINDAKKDIFDSNTNGLYILNRLVNTTINLFRNKVKYADELLSSTKPPDQKVCELARRSTDGSVGLFSTSQIAFSFAAKGLTDAHEVVIVDAFEEYMDAKGKGVI